MTSESISNSIKEHLLEEKLQSLSISPKMNKSSEFIPQPAPPTETEVKFNLPPHENDDHPPVRKPRPQTAPAYIRSTNEKMAVYASDPLPHHHDTTIQHHVNLRPRSENPLNMRPQSARITFATNKSLTYEYSGPVSSYRSLNPFLIREPSLATISQPESTATTTPDTYYLLRAAKQPTAPVAPTIVKTQTVRCNLDSFSIEKVALRRLRFVVENNESDVEHLSLVDLIEAGQVPPPIICSFFGAEFATPHDLRVLLLQSIDKARRIRRRRKNMHDSPSPDLISPSEHPIHDQPPPNKGLSAAYHHTHPHYTSPATPIASYSTYTTQSYPQPQLCSATTPAEIVSRDSRKRVGSDGSNTHDTNIGGKEEAVPRLLEDKHEVQALLMLTHTTSDAAANIVVDQEMKIAASGMSVSEGSLISGRRSVLSTRSGGSAKSRRSVVTSRSGSGSLTVTTLLSGRVTPVPATCMPSRALTPTAAVIATDAAKTAVLSVKAVRRVTTPNEILDVLRQVEGPNTVLKGVVGEGWKRSGDRRRKNGEGMYVNLEEIILRNMDLQGEGSVVRRASTSSRKGTSIKSALSDRASMGAGRSPRTKKHVRLLAEEPPGGEPDFLPAGSLDFLPRPKNDASSAVGEQHMLRIIERRRARYLVAGV
ncbi:UNVERIFIED_CONTAM: hypothetical protein HDU68_009127 [Siphonaria sp. JEL0065]|nr:hypothetical protein HDU68_009127 [Siphonaria sp. JEL0065]